MSKSSSAASTSAASAVRLGAAPTGRAGVGVAAAPLPGVQPLARAYSDWNEAIDQYVRITLEAISSSTLCPTRRADHGEPLAAMNQRTRVGAVPVHQRDRLEDVAQVLAHLAAVLGEDVARGRRTLR